MRQGWRAVLGPVASFPRELMFPSTAGEGRIRITVSNLQEYFAEVEAHAPYTDVWVGKQAVTRFHANLQDRFWLDIDSPDPEDALDQTRILSDTLRELTGVRPAVIFTGNKGYHLHLHHDPLTATGPSYGDAVMDLLRGVDAFPDSQPLANFRSMPRPPYTVNGKSLRSFGELLYTVPIDVEWSLDEVRAASREVRPRALEVPYAHGLAELLAPACKQGDERRRARALRGIGDSAKTDLIHAAITFSEQQGWRLAGRGGHRDGLRRVIWALYVPALLHTFPEAPDEVERRCRLLVERAGGSWHKYQGFVRTTMTSAVREDGEAMFPMRLRRFFARFPELSPVPPMP